MLSAGWIRWAAGVAMVFAAHPAAAEQGALAPVPWALTGTSSMAVQPEAADHTVQERKFDKAGRVLLRTGFTYLSRGDFHTNPGLSAEASWYPREYLAVDVVSATLFFSQLGQTARTLRLETGLLPDAQRLRARVTTGGRFSFAYGKALIELLDTVVHLDASVHLHLGVLVTDEAVNFAGDTGLSVQVLAWRHLLVWTDLSWLLGYERRTSSSVTGGVMGTLGVGWAL